MDATWFQQALDQAGVSQADLARHLRLAPSAISRMLKGERQMKLLEAVQVATFLGIAQDEVLRRAGADIDPPPNSKLSRSEPPRRGRPPRPLGSRVVTPAFPPLLATATPTPRSESIPIRSAARGGNDQQMFLQDGPIGFTQRPANLTRVRDAYAIYMIGDSMEPRYEQGWLLHVNPFKPPVRGRDVVVYKKGDAVLIKQFIRWEGDMILLRQLNPEGELRIPRDDIIECHLVVGVDQEG
ncbi:MAG TPA: LexA family transcriptional regulator [Stellaceae bacterium]|jgi:SOS-response transcriptional repressor LexA|nr:LexA family transcriptional regulator [Stellaceae bacterium]